MRKKSVQSENEMTFTRVIKFQWTLISGSDKKSREGFFCTLLVSVMANVILIKFLSSRRAI